MEQNFFLRWLFRFGIMSEMLIEQRKLEGALKVFVQILAASFSAFYIYTALFGLISGETHRGIYFLLSLVMTFLLYKATLGSSDQPSGFDWLLAVLATVAISYWILQYDSLQERLGWEPRTLDVILGSVVIILSLEAARRVTGTVIPVLSLIFLIYAYLGSYLPGWLHHDGFSFSRIVEYTFITSEGMLGIICNIFATYIFLFIVFGAFLERSGLGQLFIDLAFALTGHKTGGPGLTAVVSSGIFGQISGSPVANVVTTGAFTIPLMKRVGYPAHFAAAVEAAASTGGAYMPPIMGAAAFLIAEFTQTPYLDIVKISIIPAILYFGSVGAIVYLEARKQGLRGVPREELPSLRGVLRRSYQLLPIPLMIYLLMKGYSPFYAAVMGIFLTVALSWIRKDTRMGPRKILEALVAGARTSLTVGSLTGVLGIILGVCLLTGLPNQFAGLLLEMSGGHLPVVILFIIFAGYVIGMGLPATPSYVILALFGVPALVKLGVPALTAHMIAFWVAVNSVVTPPVALAAYAAAGLAKCDPFKAGFTATKLASWLYLMPFLFVYTPILGVGQIAPLLMVRSVATCILGFFAWAAAVEGYLVSKLHWGHRMMLFFTAVMLLDPGVFTDMAGVVLLGGIFAWQKRWISRRGKPPSLSTAPIPPQERRP